MFKFKNGRVPKSVECAMPVIRLANVGKLTPVGIGWSSPVEKDGYVEYEVSEEMRDYWESLSPRERETLWNIAIREKKDLRDILSAELKSRKC